MEYWIVPVSATYAGDATGKAGFDIAVKLVRSNKRTYDDSCGVIPNPLNEVGALYKGGSAQGNVRVAVPAGAEGLWTVSTSFGDPVFVEAKTLSEPTTAQSAQPVAASRPAPALDGPAAVRISTRHA